MKVEQVATWAGLFTAIGGAAANYGMTENKVATLQDKMAELYNVEEIRVLERRLTTLEVNLHNVQNQIQNVEVADTSDIETRTSEIQSGVSVNKSTINNLQAQFERLEKSLENVRSRIAKMNDSPL